MRVNSKSITIILIIRIMLEIEVGDELFVIIGARGGRVLCV